jgi:hypothetical protein
MRCPRRHKPAPPLACARHPVTSSPAFNSAIAARRFIQQAVDSQQGWILQPSAGRSSGLLRDERAEARGGPNPVHRTARRAWCPTAPERIGSPGSRGKKAARGYRGKLSGLRRQRDPTISCPGSSRRRLRPGSSPPEIQHPPLPQCAGLPKPGAARLPVSAAPAVAGWLPVETNPTGGDEQSVEESIFMPF